MITRMKTDPKFLELAKHSSHNEIEILHSKTCSCYFCRQTYSARDVNDWTNDKGGVTALCPICGMDSVIGDACGVPLDKNLLKDLNQAFYGEDYMEKHPAAALKYVERYKQGNITHKKVNESLYIQYLSLLAGQGNSVSAYDLGQLYENGTEFTPKDPKTAFSYYGMACLSSDGGALTRLGVLSESGGLGAVDLKGAYECYAKGMAMGSLEALVHFADCYSKGLFVEKTRPLPMTSFRAFGPNAIPVSPYRRAKTSTFSPMWPIVLGRITSPEAKRPRIPAWPCASFFTPNSASTSFRWRASSRTRSWLTWPERKRALRSSLIAFVSSSKILFSITTRLPTPSMRPLFRRV